ncbi:hypothetical protein P7B02_10110 [Caulobacter segnis]|uniref:hypothetical protein n=1 Tax=Caulobacter segnis TaxID=88688 RepID=UPI00241099A1|nr:hypothetical protein [Caulobacter segnis]MDG2521897.1 hypothetical protein [Caulobacter segnis]
MRIGRFAGYGSLFLLVGAYLAATSALAVAPPKSGPALWHLTAGLALLAALWRGWRGVGTGDLKLAFSGLAVVLAADAVLIALGLLYLTGFERGVASIILFCLSLAQGEGAGRRVSAGGLLLIGLGMIAVFLALPWLVAWPRGAALSLWRAILINGLGLYVGLALVAAALTGGLRTALSRL